MSSDFFGKRVKRPLYEKFIIMAVVAASIFTAISVYSSESKFFKDRILMYELESMRSAVITYKLLNKSNPSDLQQLVHMKYSFSLNEKDRQYLGNVHTDKEGFPIDPFGNRYVYDRTSGWVTSTTEGYKDW